MSSNPVDMQVILPQTSQVNKLSRGLQIQQQIEQQVLAQQVQQELHHQEQQVKKTTNIENNRIDNERREQRRDQQDFTKDQGSQAANEIEEAAEKEITIPKSNLGNVLDIKI